jgi:uracil permease
MCLATIVGMALGIVFFILDKLKLTNDYDENEVIEKEPYES